MDKLELENKTLAQITSKERKERRLWNPIALREAVINAIVHNDYTNEVPPKCEIFDDRIEITSAGGLPESLSQEEFFDGVSVPRNKELMRVFKDLEMVEQLGSGIPRILDGYDRSCFAFSQHFLKMTFPKELEEVDGGTISGTIGGQAGGQVGGQVGEIANKLTPGAQKVFDLILANPAISRKEISQKLDINESAIQKYLKLLKEQKIIERVGKTTGYWKILIG